MGATRGSCYWNHRDTVWCRQMYEIDLTFQLNKRHRLENHFSFGWQDCRYRSVQNIYGYFPLEVQEQKSISFKNIANRSVYHSDILQFVRKLLCNNQLRTLLQNAIITFLCICSPKMHKPKKQPLYRGAKIVRIIFYYKYRQKAHTAVKEKKLLLIIISAFRKENKIKTFPDKAFSALGEGATWTVLRVLYD